MAIFLNIASACPPGFAANALPTDWSAFRLNAELNPVVASKSGELFRWTFKTKDGISSSPTISGQTLFVAGNDRRLYAFNLRSGRQIWTFVARNQLMTAPLVKNGVVVVGEGDGTALEYDPPHYALLGKGPSGIVGINSSTGRALWRWTVPGSAMPTGAIVDGVYLEHDAAGMLFAFRVRDGRFRWRTYLRSTAAMAAANNFRGSTVVTSGDYPNSVLAFDGTNGRVLWRTRFSDQAAAFADCPQASDGHSIYGMYLARPDDSPFPFTGFTTPGIEHAYELDGQSGKVLWDVPLVRGILPINNHAAIPVINGSSMYLGSAIAPKIFAIDKDNGRLRWSLNVRGAVKGGMVATNGRLYFGDLGGYLWAVDAATGAVVGKKKMRDTFNVGSPIVVGRTLIIGSTHGFVFALPLADIEKANVR